MVKFRRLFIIIILLNIFLKEIDLMSLGLKKKKKKQYSFSSLYSTIYPANQKKIIIEMLLRGFAFVFDCKFGYSVKFRDYYLFIIIILFLVKYTF